MPIATPEKYAEMLDTAKAKQFAFPAINVSSSQTLNAALAGFAEAGSDGIIQVSTGGAEYLSGPTVKDMVTGSVAFAAYAAEVAKKYPVNIALHTDHCPKDKLDGFVRPLLAISVERVQERPGPAVPVAHVGRLRRTAGGEPGDRPGAARPGRRGPDRPRGRDRRRRRRGGRRRGRLGRQALQHPRGRAGHRRGARHRREGPLPDRADLRQRARRLQARQRQAAPGDPAEGPGRSSPRSSACPTAPSRSTWSSTAAPARRPRRSPPPSTTA